MRPVGGAVSGDPAPTYVPKACDFLLMFIAYACAPMGHGKWGPCPHVCFITLRLWSSSLASFFRLRGPSLASLGIPKPKKGCIKVGEILALYKLKNYLCI